MSDYIKREDAIDAACANCIYDEFLSDREERIKEGIAEIPSADVVKVVRCNNCKYKEHEKCGLTKYTVREHDYCSYGEENSK